MRDEARASWCSVDLRPVNFDSARKDTLRLGFDFSKPLKSRRPSQAVIDQLRAQFGFAPRTGRRASGSGGSGSECRRRRPAALRALKGGGRRRTVAAAAVEAVADLGVRRRQPRTAAILADRHHHLRRQGRDRAWRAGARLPARRCSRVRPAGRRATMSRRRPASSTTASARGSAPITAAERGQHAQWRRPAFLAARRPSICGCSPIPVTFPRSRSSIRGCAAPRSGSK